MTELAPSDPKPGKDISLAPSDKDANRDRTLAVVSVVLGILGIVISVAGLSWSRLALLAPALVALLPGAIYFSFPGIKKWKHWDRALIAIVTIALLITAIILLLWQSNRCCVRPLVSIVTPKSTLDCRASGPQCQFTVVGRSAGVTADLQIFILVYPVHPAGSGWYVQSPPAGIGGNGDWDQAPSYIGTKSSPARGGDALQIEAVLVRAGATYNGTLLSDMPGQGGSIFDPRQINGLVSQSDIVLLQVLR